MATKNKGAFGRPLPKGEPAEKAEVEKVMTEITEAPKAETKSEAPSEPKAKRSRKPSEHAPIPIDPAVLLTTAIKVSKAGGTLHDVVRELKGHVPEAYHQYLTTDLVASRLGYMRKNETLKAAGIIVPKFGEARAKFDWSAVADLAKAVQG